jgi:hypothetical protein
VQRGGKEGGERCSEAFSGILICGVKKGEGEMGVIGSAVLRAAFSIAG